MFFIGVILAEAYSSSRPVGSRPSGRTHHHTPTLVAGHRSRAGSLDRPIYPFGLASPFPKEITPSVNSDCSKLRMDSTLMVFMPDGGPRSHPVRAAHLL